MSQASESLLKRLAGPSVTKAGLATDQSAINAVIAEVSKGSKFYEVGGSELATALRVDLRVRRTE